MISSKKTKSTPKSRSASKVSKVKMPKSDQFPVMAAAAYGEVVKPHFAILPGPKTSPGSVRIRGCDLISTISATNSTVGAITLPIATTLFNAEISPLAEVLSGSRVSKFAQTYDKFVFTSMKFHYSSVCSTQTNGSVITAYDTDPVDDTPPATIHGFQQFMALRDSTQSNVWKSHSLTCRLSSPQDFFFTTPNSPDERFFYQGQVYVALASPISVPANSSIALGNLYFDYDVVFYDPSIETNTSLLATLKSGTSVPLGVSLSTAVSRTNLVDPSVISFIDTAGRFIIDTSDTVGGPRVLLQNAGQFLFNATGVADYFYEYDGVQSGDVRNGAAAVSLEIGPGVTISPAVTPGLSGGVKNSYISDGVDHVDTGFANMTQVFVDPKSDASSRWIRPILNGVRGNGWQAAIVWQAIAVWWSLTKSSVQLNGLGAPFTPTLIEASAGKTDKTRCPCSH